MREEGKIKTIADNLSLSESEKLQMLKEAKGGTWYSDDWRPYCTQNITPCNSGLVRMKKMPYGFTCLFCGDIIGWDLTRLRESPLNKLK